MPRRCELPILRAQLCPSRNRTRPRAVGVAQCGKSARWPNMRKRPHCDNGEGVASASPLPTGTRHVSLLFGHLSAQSLPCVRRRNCLSAETLELEEALGAPPSPLNGERAGVRGESACMLSSFATLRHSDLASTSTLFKLVLIFTSFPIFSRRFIAAPGSS